MNTLYVTNHWDKPIQFDYAFRMYEFPVGKRVEAPEDAVRHIFGYGAQDKEPFLARLGLIRTKNDIPEGLKILEKIIIAHPAQAQNHAQSPVVERVPLPASKRAGGNLKAA